MYKSKIDWKLIDHYLLSYLDFMSAVGSHKSSDIWWLNQLVINWFIIGKPLIFFSRITPHNPFVLFFAFKRVSQFWDEGRSQSAFLTSLINIFHNLISLNTFLPSGKASCFTFIFYTFRSDQKSDLKLHFKKLKETFIFSLT